MKRKIYKNGDVVGNAILIKELEDRVSKSGINIRVANFECKCGKIFNADINQVSARHTLTCGCLRIERLRIATGYHGYRKTRYYKIWSDIKKRCYNVNSKDYKYYGERGIKLSSEFISDPVSFCEYIKSLPNSSKPKFTIDRIKNDGDYERGNIRWASRQTQTLNRRSQHNNTSGFVGVNKNREQWTARISYNNKRIHIGMFYCPIEAATARNKYIIDNNLPHKLSKI